MKKIFLLLIFSIVTFVGTLASDKGEPRIDWAVKKHDFGNIQEAKGNVSYEFAFTNTGNAPLVIISATASCGCTKPSFPTDPIKPGKSGKVKVTYNPAGRPGEFMKTIKVRTNAKNGKKTSLNISGVVVPG